MTLENNNTEIYCAVSLPTSGDYSLFRNLGTFPVLATSCGSDMATIKSDIEICGSPLYPTVCPLHSLSP